jgi:hypothetical protein
MDRGGKKDQIDILKSKEFWPDELLHPNNYKIFYWAPDYSFCGFATTNKIKQTALRWQKHPKLDFSAHSDPNEAIKRIGDGTSLNNIAGVPQLANILKKTQIEN